MPEVERVYYEHDSNCTNDDLGDPDEATGLRMCQKCRGVFDAKGNGVAVTDKRFDV